MSGLAISSTSLISFAGYLNSQTLPFYCGVGIGAIQLARVLRRTDLDDRPTCWKGFVGCGWSGFWVFVGSLADYLWLILWLIIPLRQLQHWKDNIFHYKIRLEPCRLKINIRAIISEDVKEIRWIKGILSCDSVCHCSVLSGLEPSLKANNKEGPTETQTGDSNSNIQKHHHIWKFGEIEFFTA